jgi:6-phosphogluconolactonase
MLVERRVVDDTATAALAVLRATLDAAEPGRRVAVALSGGSTPHALFRLLASESGADVDGERLEVFWGDERVVPPDHPDSNYGAAYRLWLRHGPVPPDQVHPWPTHLPPAEAAADYAQVLADHLPGPPPVFDLVFLGVGPEGHTASLFPGSPALRAETWTAAPFVPEKGAYRLTLTPRVLCRARQVVFLVAGAAKRAIVREVLDGPDRGDALPAQVITRCAPSVWILDREAAGEGPAQ